MNIGIKNKTVGASDLEAQSPDAPTTALDDVPGRKVEFGIRDDGGGHARVNKTINPAGSRINAAAVAM